MGEFYIAPIILEELSLSTITVIYATISKLSGLQIINRSSMALCIQEFEIAGRSERHIDLLSRPES